VGVYQVTKYEKLKLILSPTADNQAVAPLAVMMTFVMRLQRRQFACATMTSVRGIEGRESPDVLPMAMPGLAGVRRERGPRRMASLLQQICRVISFAKLSHHWTGLLLSELISLASGYCRTANPPLAADAGSVLSCAARSVLSAKYRDIVPSPALFSVYSAFNSVFSCAVLVHISLSGKIFEAVVIFFVASRSTHTGPSGDTGR
jgi:hypothetical protein